jgi:hypothetical protein
MNKARRQSRASITYYTKLCPEDAARLIEYSHQSEQTISQVLRKALIDTGVLPTVQELKVLNNS